MDILGVKVGPAPGDARRQVIEVKDLGGSAADHTTSPFAGCIDDVALVDEVKIIANGNRQSQVARESQRANQLNANSLGTVHGSRNLRADSGHADRDKKSGSFGKLHHNGNTTFETVGKQAERKRVQGFEVIVEGNLVNSSTIERC